VQFARAALSEADPRNTYAMTGKRKRVRGVLLWALDRNPSAGSQLVSNLVGLVKGAGGFRPGSDFYVGDETLRNAQEAFKAEGFQLEGDGNLRPLLLEKLSGSELDAALLAYVRRAQQGASDAALVTGTGKDGEPRATYLYHVADNEQTMWEYSSQAVVLQTALNPVIALELLANGTWSGTGVRGPEAFDAARFCIDTLKESVPVWKKESYDGGEEWIGRGS